MLLSNTLVYNHKMECGSDAVAMATLNLSKWASIRNVSVNSFVPTFEVCKVYILFRHCPIG